MADKPKYVKLFTPVGTAIYPRLNKPDTKFNSAGEYSVKLSIPREEAEDLIEKLEEIRDEYVENLPAKTRKTHTVVDVAETELDDEGDETGNVIVKAKMTAHVVTKAGKEWDQEPRIFDSANNRLEPIEELKIGGGSKLRLQAEAGGYDMASTKQIGVSLRLRAVQVVKLVEFGGSSPFDDYEGGDVIEAPEKSGFEEADDGPEAHDDDDY